ncbi:hypothetical protein GCM10023317_71390 [Actinopolymorpha pittospori]|uniref:Uncharacterized protein n=1 Tax=Actinopolymorpha pittospori TaxID=648752 RepID=A0A927MXE5_9ACTN|nr:hypothetical protein [Actinopolymorpha pittospori]
MCRPKKHVIQTYVTHERAYGDLKRLTVMLADEGIAERYGLRVQPFQETFQLLLIDHQPEKGGTDVRLLRVLIGTFRRRLAG